MEVRRIFDIPYYQLENFPLEKAVAGKTLGKLRSYSTREFVDTINRLSLGLWEMGVRPGDKIALVSYNNRPEWNIVDLAMQQIGAVNVPVYPTISPREYTYIFNDAEVNYAFVGYGDLLQKVREAQRETPSLQEIFTFDETPDAPFWETLLRDGDLSEVRRVMDGIRPEDLATIIYTSGTTGDPKGVMLSHHNVVSNAKGVEDLLPAKQGSVVLSFLPLCHIFERTASYAYMYSGVTIQYAESVDTLRDDLLEFRPHFFTTVPRLLEKVYERIVGMALQSGGAKRAIFLWANRLTENYTPGYRPTGWEGLQWKIADKLVFSKIRERLGGNVMGILTGAAACPYRITQFFSAAGIKVREAYGLTETSPGLSTNRFDSDKECYFGTVGMPWPGVDLRIDESEGAYGPGEGEILAKGPNIMMGYYKKPDQTAEVIDADGWFHTGDVGKWVENEHGIRFLKITDRKKELLKTSGGKYVAPSPIESRLKEAFLIEQAMVVGDGQKFTSALIVPSFDQLEAWCRDNGVAFESREQVIRDARVLAAFQAIVDEINPSLGHIEQIKKFALVPTSWDVSTGELTPTMKLKRRVILERYQQAVAEIYK
jgi:long-chain acyl-CoA synthetase